MVEHPNFPTELSDQMDHPVYVIAKEFGYTNLVERPGVLQVVQDDDPGVVVVVRGGDRPQELLEFGHSVRVDGEGDDGLVRREGGGGEVARGRSHRRGGR